MSSSLHLEEAFVVRTDSEQQTVQLGQCLGELLLPGDLVLLAGELGSGKTTLVKGVAKGLSIEDEVTSPTFVLQHIFKVPPAKVSGGPSFLVHMDAYRLERMSELWDLGVEEMVDEGGAVLIEWGDVVASGLGGETLLVRLASLDSSSSRAVSFTSSGESWAQRFPALGDAIARAGLSAEIGQGARMVVSKDA
jgi:tRNA threonylcarbamoyladenosine biosynthesis protein TsaE